MVTKIQPQEIERFLDLGYRSFDPHFHTSASYDVLDVPATQPKNLYESMKQAGFGFITFTDHDTLQAHHELPELENLVRGVEIKIKPKHINNDHRTHTLHVNVYELSDEAFDDLEALAQQGDFYGFIEYLNNPSQPLPYMLNHPTWHEPRERISKDVLRKTMPHFPVIEAYNKGRREEQNRYAYEHLGQAHNKGMVSSSDSHTAKPTQSTLVRADTFKEAWEEIKDQRAIIVEQNANVDDIYQEIRTSLDFLAQATHRLQGQSLGMRTGQAFYDALIATTTSPTLNRHVPVAAISSRVLKACIDSGFGNNKLGKLIAHHSYLRPQEQSFRELLAQE